MKAVEALLDETRRWRAEHRQHGRRIEAAAAAIREQALMDALQAFKAEQSN